MKTSKHFSLCYSVFIIVNLEPPKAKGKQDRIYYICISLLTMVSKFFLLKFVYSNLSQFQGVINESTQYVAAGGLPNGPNGACDVQHPTLHE